MWWKPVSFNKMASLLEGGQRALGRGRVGLEQKQFLSF
jgi:hypothetical protein